MSENQAGQVVCSGGFIVSGMLVGSAGGGWGGIPGILVGAGAGALWALVVCTRPAVKQFFQKNIINNIDKKLTSSPDDYYGQIKSSVEEYYANSGQSVNSSLVTDSLISFLSTNPDYVVNLANSGQIKNLELFTGNEKHGAYLLGKAVVAG
jgi:hypothetical protein